MFHSKPSRSAPCPDTAPLSLPAPNAPSQGESAPNLARALGSWNDETLAEVAEATVALEAAWPPNHPTDEIEAKHADSEQTADQSSIETRTTAPARSWVKPLAVWAPGRSRSAVRQRNPKSALDACRRDQCRPRDRSDKPPERRRRFGDGGADGRSEAQLCARRIAPGRRAAARRLGRTIDRGWRSRGRDDARHLYPPADANTTAPPVSTGLRGAYLHPHLCRLPHPIRTGTLTAPLEKRDGDTLDEPMQGESAWLMNTGLCFLTLVKREE